MLRIILITLGIILAAVIGWHFFFPILGEVIALTFSAWIIMLSTIVVLCLAIMLVFIFTSTGIFALGGFAFLWTLAAILFFPMIFPVVIPLFIILLFIMYLVRRRRKKKDLL